VKNIAAALGVSGDTVKHYLRRRGFDLLKVRLYETRGQPTLALRREDTERFISMWTSEGRPMTSEALFLLRGGHDDLHSSPKDDLVGVLLKLSQLSQEMAELTKQVASLVGWRRL